MFSFVCSFKSSIFHSYGDVTITGEELQILTYTRHSWSFRCGIFSVQHLLWHGTSVYNGYLQGPVASHLLPSVWKWSCYYLFYDCLDRGSNPEFLHARQTLYRLSTAGVCESVSKDLYKWFFKQDFFLIHML